MRLARRWATACLSLASAVLIGCHRRECVAVASPVELLEKPYPVGYPSSAPIPNRVLTKLAPGRYSATVRYEKDFMVFHIDSGQLTGYVIGDVRITSCGDKR